MKVQDFTHRIEMLVEGCGNSKVNLWPPLKIGYFILIFILLTREKTSEAVNQKLLIIKKLPQTFSGNAKIGGLSIWKFLILVF